MNAIYFNSQQQLSTYEGNNKIIFSLEIRKVQGCYPLTGLVKWWYNENFQRQARAITGLAFSIVWGLRNDSLFVLR